MSNSNSRQDPKSCEGVAGLFCPSGPTKVAHWNSQLCSNGGGIRNKSHWAPGSAFCPQTGLIGSWCIRPQIRQEWSTLQKSDGAGHCLYLLAQLGLQSFEHLRKSKFHFAHEGNLNKCGIRLLSNECRLTVKKAKHRHSRWAKLEMPIQFIVLQKSNKVIDNWCQIYSTHNTAW